MGLKSVSEYKNETFRAQNTNTDTERDEFEISKGANLDALCCQHNLYENFPLSPSGPAPGTVQPFFFFPLWFLPNPESLVLFVHYSNLCCGRLK